MKTETPWSYRAESSILHRCPAGLKLLILPVLSIAPLLGLPAMGGTAVVVLLGALAAGIRPRRLFSGAGPLALLLVFVWAVRSVRPGLPPLPDREGFFGGLVFTAGILLSFAAASLLFAVTTMTEIRGALERAELFFLRPFSRQRRGYLSLALALMLGFLPRFFELWETAETAAKARGCPGGWKRLAAVLPVVSEGMIELAGTTAEAMQARGLEL